MTSYASNLKLSAWRDDVDVSDTRRLLQEIGAPGLREQIWQRVEPYLVPGDQLKVQYAFVTPNPLVPKSPASLNLKLIKIARTAKKRKH